MGGARSCVENDVKHIDYNDFWELVKLSYKLSNCQPFELGCRSNISRPFEHFRSTQNDSGSCPRNIHI